MKRSFIYIVLVALMAVSCGRTGLKKGDWKRRNYKALNTLIKDHGTGSKAYDPKERPYAVFDFDNTTVVGDISMSIFAYQIENLRYELDPESIYDIFTVGVPNIDCALEGLEAVSVRMLATDLQNDYNWLWRNYIRNGSMSLEEVHESEEFLDFRAKMWALSASVDNTFGYEAGCLWILKSFGGMSVAQFQELAREAAAAEMKRKKHTVETWTSPDLGEAGTVSVEVPRGLGIRKEMVNLYRSLQKNGFDVYICSASAEALVEAVACNAAMDLDLDPTQVYGLRTGGGDRMSTSPSYAAAYPHTFYEGKSELIRNLLMPDHGGKAPMLVAGDSNGDYNMLTDFDGMKIGLIIDQPRTGGIQDLKKDRSGRYFVQKW